MTSEKLMRLIFTALSLFAFFEKKFFGGGVEQFLIFSVYRKQMYEIMIYYDYYYSFFTFFAGVL